jgi:hypothetical protein
MASEIRAAGHCIVAVAITTGIALGQAKPNESPTVATVCDVLDDVNRYADADIAIVGRMERSVSSIDHAEFLSQDDCDHPLTTHGHTFQNRIQIVTDEWEGMPKPPSDRPKFEPTRLAAKLSAVRKTTDLGSHQEPRFNAEGKPHIAMMPNEWAVVYGRLVRSSRFDEDCGVNGCGGDDVPLIIVAKEYEVRMLPRNVPPLRK